MRRSKTPLQPREASPRMDGVVDGVPNRVDGIKALGNAIRTGG